MAVGRVVLVAGVLVLLFIPYLLWGTGLLTAQSQARLRAAFSADQQLAGSVPTKHSVPSRDVSNPEPPQVAPAIADPPIGSPVGTIAIPKIGLSMVVIEGTDEAQLAQGPGHYPGTPLPGEFGNAAIAGHRTTYLHPFYNLDALVPGDAIDLTTLQGIFVYDMTRATDRRPDRCGRGRPHPDAALTLTTCNPRYSASQRLVLHARAGGELPDPPESVGRERDGRSPPGGTRRVGAHQDWLAASLWGVLVAALITAVWVAARRTRRGARAAVIVGGLVGWLVVVFFFFQSVAPLLPASY